MLSDKTNRIKVYAVVIPVLFFLLGLVVSVALSDSNSKDAPMSTEKYNKLTPEEEAVIIGKGTERPFSGIYEKHDQEGTYLCKQCNALLFESGDKFDAGCGWPSFDDAIKGAVTEQTDTDGRRTEILCANCNGHLGHVFKGEKLTDKNTRHCVNSLSLSFASSTNDATTNDNAAARAYFAGGCFWGTEYFLQKEPGVISTQVGYMGGHTVNPDYKSVCDGNTGHTETVEIVFDPSKTTYEKLARLFFEIHDPTQVNRQGPDIGDQYRSAVFYTDEQQKLAAEKLIGLLTESGFKVVTEVAQAEKFWPGEEYHQDYYDNNGHLPYCHAPTQRFKD